MSLKMTELPYRKDSSVVFANIINKPWSIFLDSGYPNIDSGRYDIFACDPYVTFTTYSDETIITSRNSEPEISTADPFVLLKKYLGRKEQNLPGLPFCGGAIGYFAYDLGRRLEQLPATAIHDINMPDMAVGLYDWAVIVDHQLRRSWLVGYGRDEKTFQSWSDLLAIFQNVIAKHPVNFSVSSNVISNFDESTYATAFDRIKHYIKEGDCYQVNLAQRFSVDVTGEAWDAYLRLRQLNPAPFSCYFNLPEVAVLSSSPERFLKVRNGLVESKPIKGTRRRSSFAYEDKALAAELLESEKDRAENLMIVDLLRNDLGKTCEKGSVAVPKLFALETYATVHHLVSTITGRLAHDKHPLDLLRGCFPGGSITGAPKLRSMEIIEELEPHRRNIYCGAIGYVGYDQSMDCNIAIRTMIHYQDKMYCWAGGGIVADSKLKSEYQECFHKAAALLQLLEANEIKNAAG